MLNKETPNPTLTIKIQTKLEGIRKSHQEINICLMSFLVLTLPMIIVCASEANNRPFLTSPGSLFQSESKCEIFVMVISSNFNINEN